MASADPARPREITEDDLPELAPLMRECWPEIDWEQRFRRQWFENPAWEPGISMGWAHERDGALQSFFGSIPIPYQLDGRDARAFAATTLYVRPTFRRRGWARALVDRWVEQRGGEVWVNATGNEEATALYEQLTLPRYDRRECEREALWVTRPFDHARRAAARRCGGGEPRWFQLPVALAGAAALWWRFPRPRRTGAWRWEVVRRCDAEIDELWARERRNHATMMRRDGRTLSWLYLEGESAARNTLLLGRDGDGRARALAGFREDRSTGQFHHTDLFGPVNTNGLHALVSTATRRAAEAGLAVARLWLPERAFATDLESLGIETRPCEGEIWYHVEGSEKPHFTDLDGDRLIDLLVSPSR